MTNKSILVLKLTTPKMMEDCITESKWLKQIKSIKKDEIKFETGRGLIVLEISLKIKIKKNSDIPGDTFSISFPFLVF